MTSLSTELVTGDGRLVTVGDIVNTYRNVVNVSSPSSGKIHKLSDNIFSITSKFRTVSCDTLEAIKTFKIYSLSTKVTRENGRCIDDVRCVSDAYEMAEILSVTSENGRYQAKLKSRKGSVSEVSQKQLLEIWDRSKLLKTIDISEIDNHANINTDSQFSSFVWSKFGEQDKLLYVCQRKQPKSLSFFKEQVTRDNESSESNLHRGDEYIKKEDWGESLTGIEHTIIAILDVSNNCQIKTIDVEGYSLADSKWLDNDTKIVSVAYKEKPRKLGLIYCNNRSSKLVVHDWRSQDQEPVLEVSNNTECYHNPRVNHAGDKFLYLSNRVDGTHFHSVKLFIYDIKEKSSKEIIDTKSETDFYIDRLPENCFTMDDKRILFRTSDHLRQHLCQFNLVEWLLVKLEFPTTGVNILDFQYDIILASGSEINATPTIFVAILEPLQTGVVSWHQIEACVYLDYIEYDDWKIPTEDKSSSISGLLIKPNLHSLHSDLSETSKNSLMKDSDSLPTIIEIHGGPHAAFSICYMPIIAVYARLGLQALMINYRGSTGVNQKYAESLCGRIGSLDVEDCMHAIRSFIANGQLDPSKLIIRGGSHGGFLACFLSCQQEFKFTSAIIRNPVVDLSNMHTTSDIPDWVYTEALDQKNYDPSWIPTSQDLIRMYESSPFFKVNQASVPTLMLLGNKDQRVKMCNGERWVDILKARGVETVCKVYNDKHDLAEVEVAADSTITSLIWILKHLDVRSTLNST